MKDWEEGGWEVKARENTCDWGSRIMAESGGEINVLHWLIWTTARRVIYFSRVVWVEWYALAPWSASLVVSKLSMRWECFWEGRVACIFLMVFWVDFALAAVCQSWQTLRTDVLSILVLLYARLLGGGLWNHCTIILVFMPGNNPSVGLHL